jgi:hypothetical protein
MIHESFARLLELTADSHSLISATDVLDDVVVRR